jgi:hypothetical protein
MESDCNSNSRSLRDDNKKANGNCNSDGDGKRDDEN